MVGSPRSLSVLPGAADIPTFAYGPGLEHVTAGIAGTFTIQTRILKITIKLLGDMYLMWTLLVQLRLKVLTMKSMVVNRLSWKRLVFIARIRRRRKVCCVVDFKVSGNYSISITMGGTHIYCGKGVSKKCSPYKLMLLLVPLRMRLALQLDMA